MTKRHYSDKQKAATLAILDANDGNVSKTSRDTGIPRKTITEWRDGRHPDDVARIRQEKKRDLAESLELIAHTLVGSLNVKIETANLQQAATTLGIVIDKMQLLRGDATTRNEIVHEGLNQEERIGRIADLLDAARTRRDGSAPEGATTSDTP